MSKNIFPILFLKVILIQLSYSERSARLIFLNAPAGTPKEITVLHRGAEPQDVEVFTKNFTTPFKVEKNTTALFLTSLGTLELNEKNRGKLAQVKIPLTWNKTLIFLTPDKENPDFPIKAYAANASDNEFGPGDMMILNFSKYYIQGTAGDKEVKLRPAGKKVFKDLQPDNGSCGLSLDMKKKGDEAFKRLTRKSWPYSTDVRVIFFIFSKPNSRYPTYHATTLRSF